MGGARALHPLPSAKVRTLGMVEAADCVGVEGVSVTDFAKAMKAMARSSAEAATRSASTRAIYEAAEAIWHMERAARAESLMVSAQHHRAMARHAARSAIWGAAAVAMKARLKVFEAVGR